MTFDTVISGGHVLDPGSGVDATMDVGIRAGRIAEIGPSLAGTSLRTIDAGGSYVVPGLVDLHSHVFPGVTYWGVNPDEFTGRTGVTSWIDAGSSGAFTLSALRELASRQKYSRTWAFINIAASGLVTPNHELMNLEYLDVDLLCRVVEEAEGFVRGIKVRMGVPTAGTHALRPLELAIEAAQRLELPVMTHIAYSPPSIDEVLSLLRSGDIVTHAYTGLPMKIVDDVGQLRESVSSGRERGVIIDIGHGTGSLSFDTAEKLIGAGVLPDVLSTDIHQVSAQGPMFDLPMCMSKFLELGMSFSDLIMATTSAPAAAAGLDGVGTLQPGAQADVAILTVEEVEPYPIFDAQMEQRQASRRVVCKGALFEGRWVEAVAQTPPPPWIRLTEAQQRYYQDPRRALSPSAVLHTADHFGPPVPSSIDVDEALDGTYERHGAAAWR